MLAQATVVTILLAIQFVLAEGLTCSAAGTDSVTQCPVPDVTEVPKATEVCACTCKTGYVGDSCDEMICTLGDCNNRGTAVTGNMPNCACTCKEGSTGQTCASCLPQYTGTSCETRICHADYDCNGHGSSIFVHQYYQYPTCYCLCSGGWASPYCSSCTAEYDGSNCDIRVCYVGSDCSGQGQSISGDYPDCQCTCNVPYTGASCQQQYCHKDYHCNGHATAISGTYFPSCTCSCTPQYVGNACQTRICHAYYDCNEVGLGVNGTYPNCKCLCPKGYAGRNCRTESQTLSLSPSRSLTLTTTGTNTISASVSSSPSKSYSNTVSLSQSMSHSLSGSSTFTRSATLSVSQDTASPTSSTSLSASATQSPSQTQSSSMSLSPPSSLTHSSIQTLTLSGSVSFSGTLSRTITLSEANITDTMSLPQTATQSIDISSTGSLTVSTSPTHTRQISGTVSRLASTTLSTTLSDADPSESVTESISSSIPLPVILEVLIPVAVPPIATAVLSSISGSIGGAAAAVDSQVIAVVGLIPCARNSGKDSDDLRALSIVALDDTCEGVLLGNAIAVVAGAVLSGLAIVIVYSVQRAAHLKSYSAPAPTFVRACADARVPHFFISLCVYFLNSTALCGLRILRGSGQQQTTETVKSSLGISASLTAVGWIAFALPLVFVACFPALTFFFGTRHLLVVTYDWQPRIKQVIGMMVFQTAVLDPAVVTHRLLGSVFGAYRRLGCFWTLLPHISFLAGLPMLLATDSSGTCGPFLALSSAMYLAGALFVIVTRPRRVAVSDILHAASLVANGLAVSNAAELLFLHKVAADATLPDSTSDNGGTRDAMTAIGTVVTILTVLRIIHGIGMVVLDLAIQRGFVKSVHIEQSSAKPSNNLQDSSDVKNLSSLTQFEEELEIQPLGGEPPTVKNIPTGIPDIPCLKATQDRYYGAWWTLMRRRSPAAHLSSTNYEYNDGANNGNFVSLTANLLAAMTDPTSAIPLTSSLPPPDNNEKRAESKTMRRNEIDRASDDTDTDLERYLTDEELFRREVASYYGRLQIDELLHL